MSELRLPKIGTKITVKCKIPGCGKRRRRSEVVRHVADGVMLDCPVCHGSSWWPVRRETDTETIERRGVKP